MRARGAEEEHGAGVGGGGSSSWEVLDLMDAVGLKPVTNTGAVHTEKDLKRSREMCLSMECGGFAVKGGAYDATGTCVDPPRGYIYRKTQSGLRDLARAVPPPTDTRLPNTALWLAPPDFHADTSFRPFREPGTAMHPRWKTPSMIQGCKMNGYACRICVNEPVEGTFYMTCGFHCGYSGIQEHAGGKKQVLFSVWAAPGCKCEVLACAEGLGEACGFSGEGSGATQQVTNAVAAYADWKSGTPYTLCVRATMEADGYATIFECDIFTPDDAAWYRLGKIRRPTQSDQRAAGGPLQGPHSFIEPFGGQVGSRRSGTYGPAWCRFEGSDSWESATSVEISSTGDLDTFPNQMASRTPDGRCVHLQTGGEAFDDPKIYKGPLEPSKPPAELSTLPA